MRWLPRNAGTIDLLQGKYTLILLLSVGMIEWILLVFPPWVFWIGVHILIDSPVCQTLRNQIQ